MTPEGHRGCLCRARFSVHRLGGLLRTEAAICAPCYGRVSGADPGWQARSLCAVAALLTSALRRMCLTLLPLWSTLPTSLTLIISRS